MKSLVWHGDRELAIEEQDDPRPVAGQVLLDVSIAGICGSDLHGYRGHPGPRVPPLVLGHEAVGTVQGRAGRFVPFPIVACGRCRACRDGQQQLCETRGLLGLDRPGVFAERVAVGEDALVAVPDRLSDEVAVLTEPYAVGLAAANADAVGAADRVLVIGGGTIGALTAHAASRAGARVTAVDPVPLRREVVARHGAEEVLDDVAELPDGAFDVVVDAVGIEATVQAAVRASRRGGTVTIVGLGAAEGVLPIAALVREGLTLRGHYAYTRADFEQAVEVLADDPPPLDWVTTMPLDEGARGFAGLTDRPDAFAKVVLEVREPR